MVNTTCHQDSGIHRLTIYVRSRQCFGRTSATTWSPTEIRVGGMICLHAISFPQSKISHKSEKATSMYVWQKETPLVLTAYCQSRRQVVKRLPCMHSERFQTNYNRKHQPFQLLYNSGLEPYISWNHTWQRCWIINTDLFYYQTLFKIDPSNFHQKSPSMHLGTIFLRTCIILHDILNDIFTNNGLDLVSQFYTTCFHFIVVKRLTTTNYHLGTDGQVERYNPTKVVRF